MFYWARANTIPQKIKVISILCSFLLVCGINGTLAAILTYCSSYYKSLGETKPTAVTTRTTPSSPRTTPSPEFTPPSSGFTQPPHTTRPPGPTRPPPPPPPPVTTLPPTTTPRLLGELKDAHILHNQNYIEWAYTSTHSHFRSCGSGKIAYIVNSRDREDALVAWLPTMKGYQNCEKMWLGPLKGGGFSYRPRKPGMIEGSHNKMCLDVKTQVTESCSDGETSGRCGVCVRGYPSG